MQDWKKNILIRAIKIRMSTENRFVEDIIAEYINLSDEEKTEIISIVNNE